MRLVWVSGGGIRRQQHRPLPVLPLIREHRKVENLQDIGNTDHFRCEVKYAAAEDCEPPMRPGGSSIDEVLYESKCFTVILPKLVLAVLACVSVGPVLIAQTPAPGDLPAARDFVRGLTNDR